MKLAILIAKICLSSLLVFIVWCALTGGVADACPPPTVNVFIASSDSSGSEGVGTKTITVSLSSASPNTITVPFNVTGSATGGGTDYSINCSSLTFNPYETSKNITLTINNDSVDEDNETVIITLHDPVNATLGWPISSTYTIIDDDNPPTVTIASGGSGSESAASKTIAVTLAGGSGKTVTVPFSVNGSSAATGGGVDYSISSSPLTFNPGETSKNITLTINNDTVDENDETVVIDLGTPTNATLGSPSSSTYTILDDDFSGAPTNLTVVADDASDPTTAMKVQWQDNSWHESDFLLERSPNGQDSWTSIIVSAHAGVGTVTYIDHPPLIEGSHYWYRVRARKTQ